MEEACVSDAQRMKKCLDALKEETMDDEQRLTLLENLEVLLENLDNARDFNNLNGYQFLINLFRETKNDAIKESCLSLIGVAAQNQPQVQKILLDAKVLPELIAILKESSDMKMKAKTLGCISSIVSGFGPAEQSFLFCNGLNALKEILMDPSSSVQLLRKCLFFLDQLVHSQTMFVVGGAESFLTLQRKFLSADLINHVASHFLTSKDVDVREAALFFTQSVLSLDRTCFEKKEVMDALKAVVPNLLDYCLHPETPEEVKSAVSCIVNYVA